MLCLLRVTWRFGSTKSSPVQPTVRILADKGKPVSLLDYVPRHEDVWWQQMSGQLHVPANLPSGKNPRYPMDTRLGEPQSRQGRCREQKNLADGNRTLIPWFSNTWCNPYTTSVAYKLDEEHAKQYLCILACRRYVVRGVSTTNVVSS